MQTLKTITLFATVSNSASIRTSKNGRNYTAFGVSILDNDRTRTFHNNFDLRPSNKECELCAVIERGIPSGIPGLFYACERVHRSAD